MAGLTLAQILGKGFMVEILVVLMVAFAYFHFDLGSAETGKDTKIDGIPFADTISMAGSSMQFSGGGTRFKFGVAKVYALALYVDTRAAASALKPYAGVKASKLQKDESFYGKIVNGRFPRSMLLTFHRTVDADAIANALRDALSKKLPAKVVSDFQAALGKVTGNSIAVGSTLSFTCAGDVLSIGTGEKAPATAKLSQKQVCPALFSVWLGKPPVSPQTKDGIAAGFSQRMYQAS